MIVEFERAGERSRMMAVRYDLDDIEHTRTWVRSACGSSICC
ncbi:hypothetical protein [Nocardia flavorosea]|nr:hypothetical protein [Nocardia flavorosea]